MIRCIRCLVPVLLLALAMPSGAYARTGLPDFTSLVEELAPVVVNISTNHHIGLYDEGDGEGMSEQTWDLLFGHGDDFIPMPDEEAQSLGSGLIIGADGLILTNYHVVRDAAEIVVKLNDRRQLAARIIGYDERSDLALLSIAADDLPVARIGDPREIRVGEWVLAIGSPFGFDYSVTAGIVSAKSRSLRTEQYVPFIQTDVAINPGSSGGPLFNLDGEVVGLNSQIFSRTGGFMGLSFAIPIDLAMNVASQLRETGEVQRGWLGVVMDDVDRDWARGLSLSRPEGALVTRVIDDSPAARAGIRAGDVIVRFNQREVFDSGHLPPLVGISEIGAELPVTVVRDGARQQLSVILARLPEPSAVNRWLEDSNDLSIWGMRLGDLAPVQRQALGEGVRGVQVRALDDGAASAAGLHEGDVILAVDGQPARLAAQVISLLAEASAGDAVALELMRDGETLALELAVPQ